MKKQKENVRNKKGITLIALVVTIVVLLILAGITISTLFGENGIINAARRAEEDTRKDQTNTEQGISGLEGQMNNAMDSSSLMNLIKSNNFVTTEQGNQIVSDKTGKPMIVPVGFRIASDSATEIDKGVVIEDKEHNQYVWVPVSDSQFDDMFGFNDDGANYFGKLYKFNSTTSKGDLYTDTIGSNSGNREPDIVNWYDGSDATSRADEFKADVSETMIGSEFQTELQAKFNEMAKSVKKYKGFYIGRYEASSLNTANPKSIKGVEPSNRINWYNMYKNMQGIEKYINSGVENDVKTNMIWGCQWDRTLDWIANTNSDIGYTGLKDSRTWGNYNDSEKFEYTKIDGTKETKTKYSSTLIPTGSTEYTKANNIYDLAGNIEEWTMEAYYAHGRTTRGGAYCSSNFSSAVSYHSICHPDGRAFNMYLYRFSSHFICSSLIYNLLVV